MPLDFLLFAAKHQQSPEVAVITAILGVVACVIALVGALNKSQNAVWKNGVAYCPKCGKQISFKNSRTHCRSCGYNLVQLQPVPSSPQPKAHQATARRKYERVLLPQDLQERLEQERLRDEDSRRTRQEEAAALRKKRDDEYRAKGVEPGPWAWLFVLPDVTQAILLGLAFATPAVLILILVLRAILPGTGR
jgi:hypothetical protein